MEDNLQKEMIEFFAQEDKFAAVLEENVALKQQLLDAQSKQRNTERKLGAAQQTISALKAQVKEARCDLINRVNKVEREMVTAKQRLQQFSANSAAHGNRQTKYHWYKSNRQDQGQQTDNEEKGKESKYQGEIEGLLAKLQLLSEQLSNEEALKKTAEELVLEMKKELAEKNLAVEEAQLKTAELEEVLLKSKEEAQIEMEKMKASYTAQLEDLQKRNEEVAAAQRSAEEQLVIHQTQAQQEKASLTEALELLQDIHKEEEEKWSQKEKSMSCRMDYLQSCVEVMLERKTRRRTGNWLTRCFGRSGSQ